MRIRRYEIEVTTDADGDALETLETETGSGIVRAISYVKDSVAPYDDGVDFTITVGTSGGGTVWDEDDVNSSKVIFPHEPAHTQSGEEAEADGGGPFVVPFLSISTGYRVTIANGGDTKTGTFHFYIDEQFQIYR